MANLISSTVTGTLTVTGNVTAPTFVGALSGNASTATSADQIDGVAFRNTGSNSAVNADTINSNGISYYTSGVSNFSGNATDGALYSQAYSSSWQHQIAADYRSGQIALRGKNNGTWQSWRTVWDSGNLDAFVGATVSNDTITFTKANGGTVAVTTSDANTNTWRPIDDTPVDGATTESISSNWAYDNARNLSNGGNNLAGAFTATGDITAFSDARVKENIKTIDNALDKVTQLRGVEYNKIGSEEKSIGVVAQEIREVLPEVVKENEDEMLSVAYGNITGVLIEAIKEQQKQIEELKAQLDGLTK